MRGTRFDEVGDVALAV